MADNGVTENGSLSTRCGAGHIMREHGFEREITERTTERKFRERGHRDWRRSVFKLRLIAQRVEGRHPRGVT
jgi:hypothetical protein